MPIDDLPSALLHVCFSKLGPLALLRAGVQCREWCNAANDEVLWRAICLRDFPETQMLGTVSSYKHLWARWGKAKAGTKAISTVITNYMVSLKYGHGRVAYEGSLSSKDQNEDGSWDVRLDFDDDELRNMIDWNASFESECDGALYFRELVFGLEASVTAFRPRDERVLPLLPRTTSGHFHKSHKDESWSYMVSWTDYYDKNMIFRGDELRAGAQKGHRMVLQLTGSDRAAAVDFFPDDISDDDDEEYEASFQSWMNTCDVTALRHMCNCMQAALRVHRL